jgi:hypothetical protein
VAKSVERWAKKFALTEEQVAPFAHDAGVRRRIAQAKDCIEAVRAGLALDKQQQQDPCHSSMTERFQAADPANDTKAAGSARQQRAQDSGQRGEAASGDARPRSARSSSHRQPKNAKASDDTVAEVKQIKTIGNAGFANGDYYEAYEVYQTAIDIIDEKCGLGLGCGLECDVASHIESDLKQLYIDLQNNSAEAALKAADAMEAEGDDKEIREALYAAADAAWAVLTLDKGNGKATNRLARAEDRLHELEARSGHSVQSPTPGHI